MSGHYLPVHPLIGRRFPKASEDERQIAKLTYSNEGNIFTTLLRRIEPSTKKIN